MSKNQNQLLFYVTSLVIAFGILVLLPNFTLDLGNNYRLEWKGLSSLGISENLFNFTRGRGIYNKLAQEFTAEKTTDADVFAAAFARDKFALTKRLAFINSALNGDLYIREYLPSPGSRTVTLEFPASIPEEKAKLYAEQITATKTTQLVIPTKDETVAADTGLVGSFFPGYRPAVATLNLGDILNYSIDTSSLVTYPVLRTQFKPEVAQLLRETFANTSYDPNTGAPQQPMLLVVNGIPEFWAFHPDLFGAYATRNDFPASVIWIPFAANDKLDLIINAATIFGEQPELKYTKGNSATVPADFAPEGRVGIGAIMALLFAGFIVLVWRKVGLRSGLYFGFAYLAFVLTTLALAKLVALPIEPIVLISMGVLTLILSVLLLSIFINHNQRSTSAGNFIAFSLFCLSGILLQFPAVKLVHGFEILFIVSVALLVAIHIYIPAVSHYLDQDA